MLVKSATKNNDHTIRNDDHTRHNEYSVATLNQDIINLRRLCYCLEHRIPTQKNNSDNNDSATTTLMKAKTGGEIKLKRHEIVYLQSKARISLQKIEENSSQQQHFIREEYREVVNDLKNLVERACKKISSVTEEEEENDGREMNLVDLLVSQSKLLSEDSGCDNDEVEESVGENHDEKNDEDDGYGDLGLADYDQKDLLQHNQQQHQQQENHTNDEPEEEEKSPEEILQEELTEMVSQLKQNTLRMNSQLKSQNETLLEDVGNKTSENLHNVTNVAEKTSDYNKKNKSWKSWFGSYGILISVVGTMCGMYVFMKIFPKRNYYGRSRSSYHYDEYYGNSNSNRYNNNYQSSYSKPKKKNTTPPPPETKDGMRYGGKHYGILPKTYDGAYTEQLEQEYDLPDFSYDGSWTTTTTTSSSDDIVFSYDATAFKKSHHNQKQDQQEEHKNDDKKQKRKRNSDKSSSSWRHQHSNLQSKSRNSRHTKNLQRARRNKPYEEWWDNPEEEEEQDIDSEYEYDNDYDYNNNDYSDKQEKEDSQECEAKPIPETHNNDDADSIVKNNCEINEQSDEPKLMGKSSDDLRAIHDVDMEEPGCIAAARALKQENEEDAIKAQVLDHTQNGDNEAQWMKNIKHKVREKEEGQDNNNEREKEEKKNTMPNNLNIDETFQSMLQRAQKWYKNDTQQQIELKRRDLFHLSAIDFERHPNHEPNTFRDILKEFPLLSFVRDKNGWFAIHEAARGRSLKTMKELVKHSIDFLVLEGENMGYSSLDEEEKIRKELTQKYLNLRTNYERGGNVLSWVGDSDSDDELVMYLKENGAIRIKD